MAETDVESRRTQLTADELAKYRKDIERVALQVWKNKGVRNPTYDQMQRAMSHPAIIEHAIKFAKPR
ncbi:MULTISPECIES: hypothetical protein [Mesorhizobium]|uniref:hypothetical protein n=1 Tax=Mesorhizobium sp. TaxID=1871066 RepID=UPI000493CFB6|nr:MULTISPECIES: hypothetical protein [Mesorhizobium]RWM75173.1 MAG: hypothetical protein EOR82_00420 [Mesorhizobium sp.]TIO26507.1 MAG: hypothetical protein E5X83_09005 [Mesorhizobium sp.]TJV61120.1 MAG: hypothetical protein E5X82_09735 [Mesorhizobium sp.]